MQPECFLVLANRPSLPHGTKGEEKWSICADGPGILNSIKTIKMKSSDKMLSC